MHSMEYVNWGMSLVMTVLFAGLVLFYVKMMSFSFKVSKWVWILAATGITAFGVGMGILAYGLNMVYV